MKNRRKWLTIGLAVVVLGLLAYLALPYIKFGLLYGLNDSQKERYNIVAEDMSIGEKYDLYTEVYRQKVFENFIIDIYLLDEKAVKEDRIKFESGYNAFLKDYNLEYWYRKYMRDGDKTLFNKVEDIVEKEYN